MRTRSVEIDVIGSAARRSPERNAWSGECEVSGVPTLGPLRGFLDATLRQGLSWERLVGVWQLVKAKRTSRHLLTSVSVCTGWSRRPRPLGN